MLQPNLGKSDSVSMSESLDRVVEYARSFSDGISLDDRTSLADPLATDVNAFKNTYSKYSLVPPNKQLEYSKKNILSVQG